MVGVAFTDTDATAVFEEIQPSALVPVTEYDGVQDGLVVKLPPVLVYVAAPAGMITAELPEQMVALFTEMVGVAFTDTDATAVFEEIQPSALVPVTEYDVVEDGLIVKLPPVIVYVAAPAGMITAELPEQMVAMFTEMVGVAFTDTDATAVFEEIQPSALVPVTEYDVVEDGLIVKLPPVIVYVAAPAGMITAELPEQMVALFTEMVGVAFTDT